LAIKENRRISVLELSSNIDASAGSIDTIIHEHLLYSKVTARWVPKMLTEQHKLARVSACQQLLDRFSAEGETFLEHIVTEDETWYTITHQKQNDQVCSGNMFHPPESFEFSAQQVKSWLRSSGT